MPLTPKATKAIYYKLMAYIQNPNAHLLEEYKEALCSSDAQSLMHLDSSGRSHLIQIFHLPLKIRPNRTLVEMNLSHQIRNTLFHLLMNAVSSPSLAKVKAHFLLCPTKKGFSPLHSLLLVGNADNLKQYLDQVSEAVEQGLITRTDYHRLLQKANLVGFTPLHQAVKNGRLSVLKLFIETLEKEFSRDDLRAVFYAKRKDKEYSPKWGLSNIPEDAEAIKALMQEKRIFYADKKSLIKNEVQDSSPIQDAVFSKDHQEDKFISSAISYGANRFFEFGLDIKLDSHKPTTIDDFLGQVSVFRKCE